MKKFPLIVLLLPFFLTACIGYKFLSVDIEFTNKNKSDGTIRFVYENITSSEDSLGKQEGDFKDVVKFVEDDDFLLENVQDGIYLKKRRLFEKDGALNAEFSGIFRNLDLEDQELKMLDHETVLIVEKKDGTIVSTNGKISLTDSSTIVTWPADQNKISWKMATTDNDEGHSLVDFYRKWAKKQ